MVLVYGPGRQRRGRRLKNTSVQLEPRIVELLDRDAEAEGAGTARSDIIRRILAKHYGPPTDLAPASEAAS